MNKLHFLWAAAGFAAGIVSVCSPALAQEDDDERKTVARRLGDDTFMAGSEVRFSGEAGGDAILAGSKVSATGVVQGDAVVAGGELSLQASVREDLYAAGGQVRLNGPVSGNARMAGGKVQIGSEGEVQGGATVAGGEIIIDGHVGRYLQTAGGRTQINGRIDGDVLASGGELIIGPNAVIEGSVTFKGPAPATVAPGARIEGELKHIARERGAGALKAFIGAGAIVWLIGWMIVGALLLVLWPRATRAVTQTAARRPWLSLLIGVLTLILAPALIILLSVILVGIPLAALLLLIYLLLLPLGYLSGAAAVSDAVLARLRKTREALTRHRILALLVTLLVVFLIVWIPLLGQLVAFLLLTIGLGSLGLTAFSRRSVSDS